MKTKSNPNSFLSELGKKIFYRGDQKVAQMAKNRPIWSHCYKVIINGTTDIYSIFHHCSQPDHSGPGYSTHNANIETTQ